MGEHSYKKDTINVDIDEFVNNLSDIDIKLIFIDLMAYNSFSTSKCQINFTQNLKTVYDLLYTNIIAGDKKDEYINELEEENDRLKKELQKMMIY